MSLKPHVMERTYPKSHATGSGQVGPLGSDWTELSGMTGGRGSGLLLQGVFSGMCAPSHYAHHPLRS